MVFTTRIQLIKRRWINIKCTDKYTWNIIFILIQAHECWVWKWKIHMINDLQSWNELCRNVNGFRKEQLLAKINDESSSRYFKCILFWLFTFCHKISSLLLFRNFNEYFCIICAFTILFRNHTTLVGCKVSKRKMNMICIFSSGVVKFAVGLYEF
jgi:hypothetical protein